MEVFHRLGDLPAGLPATAVAIGNFDGVHLGHAALLRRVIELARREGAKPTVLTFFPHPVEVLNPKIRLERISTAAEKLALLEALGIELVLVERFDRELSTVTPEAFFERYLARGLKAKSVHVGFNFMFGRGRAGNTQVLADLCRRDQIALVVEPPFELGGEKVDSSTIRSLIAAGHVEKAARLLGRPYVISGQVAHGDHRGASLGFPTANVAFPDEKVLPKHGVYITKALWQRQSFLSVTNVGIRPTFESGKPAPRIEVHILDFNSRLYDETLQVEFLARVRDEMKFSSLEALKEQIQRDVTAAREFKSN